MAQESSGGAVDQTSAAATAQATVTAAKMAGGDVAVGKRRVRRANRAAAQNQQEFRAFLYGNAGAAQVFKQDNEKKAL